MRSILIGILLSSLLMVPGLPVSEAAVQSVGPVPPATSLGFTFKTRGLRLYDLPREAYPYARNVPIARRDSGAHDAGGVRMVRRNDRLYDHPVAQATYGLLNLESYRASKDSFYLQRAKLQAQRLMQRAHRTGRAWYFPYPFDFNKHRLASERMNAPWYSAMAQGQALSLFVRLAEVTGDDRYRTAANAAFASFLRPRGRATPWTVWVDSGGYLWLEEYAGPRPDRTYNGQMFAAWGLWDYWRLTKDARAQQLWDGALTTVIAYASTIRNAGWVSSYCLNHQRVTFVNYHLTHISQLTKLYAMSHSPALALAAEALSEDYPSPDIRGAVRLAPGRHVAYRFNSAGRATTRTPIELSHASSVPANQRIRIKGQPGIWYRITAGRLAGLYLQERPGTAALAGSYITINWSPTRTARLRAGKATAAYRFSMNGTVTGTRRVTPSAPTAVPVSRTAYWNAVRHALIADGPLAGYWVPVTAVNLT